MRCSPHRDTDEIHRATILTSSPTPDPRTPLTTPLTPDSASAAPRSRTPTQHIHIGIMPAARRLTSPSSSYPKHYVLLRTLTAKRKDPIGPDPDLKTISHFFCTNSNLDIVAGEMICMIEKVLEVVLTIYTININLQFRSRSWKIPKRRTLENAETPCIRYLTSKERENAQSESPKSSER